MDTFLVPQGEFQLSRWPLLRNDRLRAWDSADELLLHHLADEGVDLGGAVMVVNDSWGALATALAQHRPQSWGDSFVAQLATRANLAANGLDRESAELLGSFNPPPDRIDLLLVKVPRSLALLEDQLRRLAPQLHDGSVVIGAGMTKHVHRSTIALFEALVGSTRTSLARRKARLIHPDVELLVAADPSPWPTTFTLAPEGLTITNQAGVFSGSRLDAGTRLFLDQLPHRQGPERVVDLGCGNGVVGVLAAIDNPAAELTFVDESFAAVASAEATFRMAIGPDRPARFVAGDGIAVLQDGPPIDDASIDLVLCNPPFHVNHAIEDASAWHMFTDAYRALRPGGELWVVGNRHLAYHAKLKRLFGSCSVVASNTRFVVFRAVRA